MSYVADALREHHKQLQQLIRAAGDLADRLETPDVGRGELRDLLQREFRLDMAAPAAGLWLETVIDDIAWIVAARFAADVRELADAITDAACDVDVEEAAADAVAERRVNCLDCGASTVGELYMLHDQVWAETGLGHDDGLLCIGCCEERLGRQLRPDDFTDAPCNTGTGPWGDLRSPRLRSRVLGLEEAPAA